MHTNTTYSTAQSSERSNQDLNCICCKCGGIKSSTNYLYKSVSGYTSASEDDCSCQTCMCFEAEVASTTCDDCEECVCPVCPKKKDTVTFKSETRKTTCDCEKCVCHVCPYNKTVPAERGDIGTTGAGENRSQQKEQSESSPSPFCKCPTFGGNPNKGIKTTELVDVSKNMCNCRTCQDPSMYQQDFFKIKVLCNCVECLCNPCADENKKKQIESTKETNITIKDQAESNPSRICKCLTCGSNTIMPESFNKPNVECNCNVCKCSPCIDPNKGNKTTNLFSPDGIPINTCNCYTCQDPSTLQQNYFKPKVSCNCMKCLCSPCPDEKQINIAVKEQSGKNPSLICKCLTCGSNTIMPESFNKPNVECNCNVCKCSPCIDPNKGIKTTNLVSANSIPINKCNCYTCQDPSTYPPDYFKTKVPCNCTKCECNPCADDIPRNLIESTKETNITAKGTTDTANSCTCINKTEQKIKRIFQCSDQTCPSRSNEAYGNNPKKTFQQSVSPDGDISKKTFEQFVSVPCDCQSCTCPVCNNPNIVQAKGDINQETQLSQCHCSKCTCESRLDPKAEQTVTQTVEQTVTHTVEDKTNDCKCVACTCTPCEFPYLEQSLTCQCIVCNCSLCQLTMNESPVQAAIPCDCPVCACSPCNDQNVHLEKTNGDNNLPGCTCLVCSCNPCPNSETQKIKQSEKSIAETMAQQQTTGGDRRLCDCVPCGCTLCLDSIKEQQPKKIDTADKGVSCCCSICNCEPSKDLRERGDQIESGKNKEEENNTDKPLENGECCECKSCICENKSDNSVKISRSIHDRDCICRECLCEELQKSSAKEFEDYHCASCTCSKCMLRKPCRLLSNDDTKLLKSAKADINENAENSSSCGCVCSECNCDCNNDSDSKSESSDHDMNMTHTHQTQEKQETDNKRTCTCSPCSCSDCILKDKMKEPNMIVKESNVSNKPHNRSFAAYHTFVDPINLHKKLEMPIPQSVKLKPAKETLEANNLYNYFPMLFPPSTIKSHKQAKRGKNCNIRCDERQKITRSAEASRFKQFDLSTLKHAHYSDGVFPLTRNKLTNQHNISDQPDPNKPEKPYVLVEKNESCSINKSKYDERIKNIDIALNKIKGFEEKYTHKSPTSPLLERSSEDEESIAEHSRAFKDLQKYYKTDDKKIRALTQHYTSSTTLNSFLTDIQDDGENDLKIIEQKELSLPNCNAFTTSVPNISVLLPEPVKVRPSTAAPGHQQHRNICSHLGDNKLNSSYSKLIRTIDYDCYDKHIIQSRKVADICSENKKEIDLPLFNIPLRHYQKSQKGKIPFMLSNHNSMLNIVQSISTFNILINTLKDNYKSINTIIKKSTSELNNQVNRTDMTKTINNLGRKAANIDQAEDIKITKTIQTQSKYTPGVKGKTCISEKYNKYNKLVNLSGFRVTNVRRITADSIVIEWKCPKSQAITGYEIEINGKQMSKILSGWRTCAIINSLDLSTIKNIAIYAITAYGRCEPPAKAIYEIKQKSKKKIREKLIIKKNLWKMQKFSNAKVAFYLMVLPNV